MKTKTKVGLIASISMIVIGTGMIAASLSSVGWNWTGLFHDSREKRVVGVEKPYTSVVVNTAADSIELDYSPDNKETVVELYDNEAYPYDVYVSDDTLFIVMKEEGFSFNNFFTDGIAGRKVTVKLVGGEYDVVNVRTGIGNIDVKGSMYVNRFISETGIGDIDVAKTVAIDKLNAKTGIGGISVPKASGLTELQTGIGNIRTDAYKDRSGNLSIHTGIGKAYAQ